MSAPTRCVRTRSVCRSSFLSLLGLSLLLFAGCGGEDATSSSSKGSAKPEKKADVKTEKPSEPPKSSPDGETVAPAPPATTKPEPKVAVDPDAIGSFSGTVVLDGEAPESAPLVKGGDEGAKDKEVCAVVDVPDESLLVGEDNGIANVFVYLRRAPKGFTSDPPSDPVTLDQKGCVFLPHVALIRAGQKVLVKSSDAVQHNVHTFPDKNQATNLLINPNDQTGLELTYNRAESDPLQVKCDIHAWMSSYHLVLDHPFMAITDANGKFSIDSLPAGEYEFRVWHERGGLLERAYEATVTGEDEPVTLKFAVDKFPTKG